MSTSVELQIAAVDQLLERLLPLLNQVSSSAWFVQQGRFETARPVEEELNRWLAKNRGILPEEVTGSVSRLSSRITEWIMSCGSIATPHSFATDKIASFPEVEQALTTYKAKLAQDLDIISDKRTHLDKWMQIIKNNRIAAGFIIFFTTISAALGFSDSILKAYESIRHFFFPVTCDAQRTNVEKLMESSDQTKLINGISLLQEVAKTCPSERQALINILQQYLIKMFPQDREIERKYLPVLKSAIRAITTLPRNDENGFPLNIDIHQIRIQDIELPRTNFKDLSLWGSQFLDVDFSRSSFQNADLGGTQFLGGSLEYSTFDGAKITGSFMDKGRPTRFVKTRLYGTNIERAIIDNCELSGITDFPVEKLAGRCRLQP